MTDEKKGVSSRAALLAVAAALVVAAVGYWVLRPAPAPSPEAAAGPSGAVSPAASPEAEPTPEAAAAGPAGVAKPGAAPRKPGPPGPKRPVVPAVPESGAPLTPEAMLRRAFVPALSAEESLKGISKNVSGFDLTHSPEVDVKRAADVSARIVFYSAPPRVKPGDAFTVRVALVNDGKKTFEMKEVQVAVLLNDTPVSAATGTVKPRVKKIAPRQEEVIHEVSGTWDKDTRSWALRVGVLTDKKDLYRNELTWK
jgi:hypothetical protein